MAKNKGGEYSEREERIRVLENQNIKFVDESNNKQHIITGLKQRNLDLEEQLTTDQLKSKLRIKEKQFEIDSLKKQLAYQKEQTRSEVNKYNQMV